MAGALCRVDRLPPELAKLVDGLTVLCAYNDQQWLTDLAALVEHRVEWVKEKADADDATKRKA